MLMWPVAAASRMISTKWSANKLISSTYSTPPFASLSKPGWYSAWPVVNTRSTSIEPTTRSSVAPNGRLTTFAFGSGSIREKARTVVVFAVPFSPRTTTPPMRGEIAVKISANFSWSCPTTALKGKSETLCDEDNILPTLEASYRERFTATDNKHQDATSERHEKTARNRTFTDSRPCSIAV